MKIWKDLEVTELSWQVFLFRIKELLELQYLPDDDFHFRCLRALLEVNEKTQTVTKSDFEHFLNWFGPMQIGREQALNWLHSSVVDLLKQKWFHGPISPQQAEERISKCEKKNAFLVRFSETTGAITVTYCIQHKKQMDKQFKHVRLTGLQKQDLTSYISSWAQNTFKETKMYPCSYGRKYQYLFSPETRKNMTGMYVQELDGSYALIKFKK
eukprot:TRINITY_DN11338_c0_g1_i2.p1 TRINITY_DN11338_c0_g1~~TRINITY_DN11338_c0_g1_i2.p1  ORF type:complete len:212 (-),score=34.72 TRINITY_DN11338_c0_g1_i2:142-777(-)